MRILRNSSVPRGTSPKNSIINFSEWLHIALNTVCLYSKWEHSSSNPEDKALCCMFGNTDRASPDTGCSSTSVLNFMVS